MGFKLHSSVWIMDDVGVSNLICIFPLIMSLCTRNIVGGRVSLWILRGYGSWVGLITITWSHPFVSALFKKSASKLREDLLFWANNFVRVWHKNKKYHSFWTKVFSHYSYYMGQKQNKKRLKLFFKAAAKPSGQCKSLIIQFFLYFPHSYDFKTLKNPTLHISNFKHHPMMVYCIPGGTVL